MSKHRLRRWAAHLAGWTGLRWLHEARLRDAIVVLMYHRVLPVTDARRYPFPSLVVPADAFRRQVQWLSRNADCSTMREALTSRRRGIARPTVVITFDDGYADNAEIAAPILDQCDVPATFFVSTSFVQGQTLWFDRAAFAYGSLERPALERATEHVLRGVLPASDWPQVGRGCDAWVGSLKRVPGELRSRILDSLCQERIQAEAGRSLYAPMTVGQIRDLCTRGHEIASHTVTHPLLDLLSPADLHRELADSKSQLETWTGQGVVGLCYPNGNYDAATIRCARGLRYSYACTVERGLYTPGGADPYTIPRRMITETGSCAPGGRPDGPMFRAQLAGIEDSLKALAR